MTEDQRELLAKARESLSAAQLLLRNQYADYAASRAYYSMFYIAQAFLEGESKSFSSHAAVVAAFGRDFAHAGKVPVEFHRWLIEAQALRQSGDYGQMHIVTDEQASAVVTHAQQLLELAERLIGPIS
jgi:uncharacterized protein (UPF0332 family)